jgi:hypothetical protein
MQLIKGFFTSSPISIIPHSFHRQNDDVISVDIQIALFQSHLYIYVFTLRTSYLCDFMQINHEKVLFTN